MEPEETFEDDATVRRFSESYVYSTVRLALVEAFSTIFVMFPFASYVYEMHWISVPAQFAEDVLAQFFRRVVLSGAAE